MPKSTLRILVKNLFKESFYGKEKKKNFNIFFIFYKSGIKTFLKWIINQYLKSIKTISKKKKKRQRLQNN